MSDRTLTQAEINGIFAISDKGLRSGSENKIQNDELLAIEAAMVRKILKDIPKSQEIPGGSLRHFLDMEARYE
jgi:hypothetical protein